MRDDKDPTMSRQSAHRWRLGCQPYTPAALYLQKDSGTHFCYRLSKPRSHYEPILSVCLFAELFLKCVDNYGDDFHVS
jgi:hypothetical protein